MDPIPSTPTPAVEVEFALADHRYPFVRGSAEAECRLDLQEVLPRGEGRYAELFSVAGARPGRILDLVESNDRVDARLLADHGDGGLLEFVVSEGCPVRTLAERGGTPVRVTCTAGDGRIVWRLPADCDATDVVDSFLATYPTAELVAKRQRDRAVAPFTGDGLRRLLEHRLTDRQREVLERAYEAGYFERPRETTGEELAADLDICAATLSQHVRAAQNNLLSIVYEERSL